MKIWALMGKKLELCWASLIQFRINFSVDSYREIASASGSPTQASLPQPCQPISFFLSSQSVGPSDGTCTWGVVSSRETSSEGPGRGGLYDTEWLRG